MADNLRYRSLAASRRDIVTLLGGVAVGSGGAAAGDAADGVSAM
jgi:hypothetical protein